MMWILTVIFVPVVIISIAVFILYRIKDPVKLNKWVKIGTVIGGFFTGLSLFLGAITFLENAYLQKKIAVSSIYQEHMKISIDNPELANGEFAPELPQGPFPDKVTEEGAKNKFEKYQWYVGHTLFGFEGIFEAMPGDEGWEATATDFIKGHQKYIKSKAFPCKHYSDEIKAFIYKVVGNCG